MRGESDLIVAVMLIVVGVLISILAYSWLVASSSEKARTVANATQSRFACQYAGIAIGNVTFDCNGGCFTGVPYRMNATVENTGETRASIGSIALTLSNGMSYNVYGNASSLAAGERDTKQFNAILVSSSPAMPSQTEDLRKAYANDSNTVALWHLDDGSGSSAADSARGNAAVVAGATWNASGKFSSALSFDGISAAATVPYAATLNLTSAITVEGWFNAQSASGGSGGPSGIYLWKRPITIGNSIVTLTNYQVLVTLDTGALISQGKIRSDCGDMRFTASDETTLLNYYLESGCNSTSTRFWVNVTSIPLSGTTIYAYYGNPNANSTSNGSQVFEFFDDFTGSSLDTNKWTVNLISTSVANSILTLNAPTGDGGISSIATFSSTPYRVVYRARLTTTTGGNFVNWGFSTSANPWATRIGVFGYDSANNRFGTQNLGIGDCSPNIGGLDTNFHTFATILGTRFEKDGSAYPWCGPNISSAKVAVSTWSAGTNAALDWVFLTKYVSSEPTVTVGNETAAGFAGIKKSGSYALGTTGNIAYASINGNIISGNLSPGWNHLALSYDGTTERLYVNGAEARAGIVSAAIDGNGNDLVIGGSGYNGSIDEVRISNVSRAFRTDFTVNISYPNIRFVRIFNNSASVFATSDLGGVPSYNALVQNLSTSADYRVEVEDTGGKKIEKYHPFREGGACAAVSALDAATLTPSNCPAVSDVYAGREVHFINCA